MAVVNYAKFVYNVLQ